MNSSNPGPNVARTLPLLNEDNTSFWTGGATGALLIKRCKDCGRYMHPPTPRCTNCLSANVASQAVSGRATVVSFTLNHQRWVSGLKVPYAIAIVELDEQPNLRLTTNIVNCALQSIAIGMRVRVVFEQQEDIYLPLFEPEAEA